MKCILALALLYLASAEGSDHAGLPPILIGALDLGSKKCDRIFDITKEDRENFKYFTIPTVTERFQRYLLCQFLVEQVLATAFTIHHDIMTASIKGKVHIHTQQFIDCFEEAKENAGDAKPYEINWNAVECLADKIRGQ